MIHDIRELMGKGESENIEYKEEFNRGTIGTCVAFANIKRKIETEYIKEVNNVIKAQQRRQTKGRNGN
jgi:predicted HTH transcriptional regulator